ncbi:CotH kinase family protein [Pseudocolwellia sp. HL-MZ19]|uniref:CotH kinase family protein n=1 Tax=Pseudocolwellia sp. HL-MZ19 TaxID=3400846 RepID=UPI003CE788DB
MYKNHILSSLLILSSTALYGCGSSDTSASDSGEEETGSTEVTESTPAATSNLVINEIVAKASDGGNDWIELYATDGSVDLSNFSIVDDDETHEAQSLPEVTLAEGEFIVIQAIDEEDTPPETGYYVTFKLGSEDSVTLFQDDVQVDQLAWLDGDAPEGFSYGLFVDGSGDAQLLSPTPGAANEIAEAVVVYDEILNEKAPLRINEVVAKDSDGNSDWIEFYAAGSSAVNLGDYTIKDEDSELISLPDVTLAAGEFYRVYATTGDIEGDTSAEAVAFKLGSSDEVSLFLGDDLVDKLEWNNGDALIGFSYGRFPDGSDGTQILTPSPLTTNVIGKHGALVINEVVASDINGGDDWFELYNNGSVSIQLSDYQIIDASDDIDPVTLPDVALQPGEYIGIYATDSNPSDYYVPFKLGKSDELTLSLDDETVDYIDWEESDVISGFSYGLSSVTSDTRSWDKDFLTPTFGTENVLASAFDSSVVKTLSITITDENWQDILDNPLDEEYHEASISFNGVELDSVAIRTKGGSSLSSVARLSSDRYSFKVDINEYVDGQKFFGLKKFTLQNSYNDPSYMREVIAYDLLKEMGVPTPEHSYVNFYINDELFGFYLMVEAIDSEFVENHFDNANGDLYKPDGEGSDLIYVDSDISSYSEVNLKTNEDSTDNGAFINFVEQLDQGSTDVVDVDLLLRYMSVSVALSNLDSYHGTLAHNYYLYEQDGTFSLLPWDFNESFGTFTMGCSNDVRELYIDEPVMGAMADRPLVNAVFSNDTYLATYHDYLWELINGSLVSTTFADRVNSIADLIREHVENDPSGFYGASNFETNLTSSVSNFWGLTEFMDYRVDHMTMQLQGDVASAGNGFCSR